MTTLSFDEDGVDVEYQGTEFRLPKTLIENATDKPYNTVTDHEILKIIEKNPTLNDNPKQVKDILESPQR